jgi:metallophosphoesterase (TIGR00282 family)
MKFLVLGDIFPSALKLLEKKIPLFIKNHRIDFIIANGENAANDANGITINTSKKLFDIGIDVLTSGNHIWDKKEILEYIRTEKRLLRPLNMSNNLPGIGINVFEKKGKKICVINLMTNYFMSKSNNVFAVAKSIIKRMKLKKNCDYIIVDIHGEFAGEKMALSHLFDGKSTIVFGSHTHIPTSDSMILPGGTAYQTDLGMCGDYDSVIGLNKKIFLRKMLKIPTEKQNLPSFKNATICGAIIKANNVTGLANSISQIIIGGNFNNKILTFK